MPEVSDFAVVLGGADRIIPGINWERHFKTGGRNKNGDAVLIVNARSNAESDVPVRINNEIVGHIHNYHGMDRRNWLTQTIVFKGEVLKRGWNEFELDVEAGDLEVKDIVCWFQQSA